jgi:hypothetical protein
MRITRSKFKCSYGQAEETSTMTPRWLLARTTGRAHLDLGERSSRSLHAKREHFIVTACHLHLEPHAAVVPESFTPRCANCLRVARHVARHQDAREIAHTEAGGGYGIASSA